MTKLAAYKKYHLQCVCEELQIKFSSYHSEQELIAFISAYANNSVFAAHHRVCEGYSSGKYRRQRGRPMGWTGTHNMSDTSTIRAINPIDEEFPSFDSLVEELTGKDEVEKDTSNLADMSLYVLKSEHNHRLNQIYGELANQTDKIDRHTYELLSLATSTSKDYIELQKQIAAIKLQSPTVVELVTPELPPISMGVQHNQFPTLLKMCNARLRDGSRLNIWVHGPSGTGKTSAARNVAKALSLPFHYNGALATQYQLMGYNDANGRYVTTEFRQAYEFGGVYLFDEIDASMPDALLALNGALANGICPFPDKIVPRHPDCIILAGANTSGTGATMEYVGRMKQDAALTDRFVFLDWPIDLALESAICANQEWLDKVRKAREGIEREGIKNHKVTSRAALFGEALLAAGVDLKAVEHATLKKGLTDAMYNNMVR